VGVSSRRTLILIAAVVVGAISAFLVFNYVNSADDRARSNARQVDVLVINGPIEQGLSGAEAQAQGLIVPKKISADLKPETAINDVSIISDKVAVSAFVKNQVLVDGMFADPVTNQITFAGRLDDGCSTATNAQTGQPEACVAITISVDQTRGVAGVIVPGDYVNVLVTPETFYCTPGESTTGPKSAIVSQLGAGQQGGIPSSGGAAICSPARYLYQKVKVLFVDKTAVPQPGTAAGDTSSSGTSVNSGLITLEVPPVAAQTIASVTPDAIYLSLVPQDYTPTPLPNLDPFPQQLPGEDPATLTPYGPQGLQTKK
jgi:Flp pilus assembly protein CpaB